MYILSPMLQSYLTSWSLLYLLALLGIFQFLGGRVIQFLRTSVQKITILSFKFSRQYGMPIFMPCYSYGLLLSCIKT